MPKYLWKKLIILIELDVASCLKCDWIGRRYNRWCKRYKYLKIRRQNQQCGGKGKYSKPKAAKYCAAIFGEHLKWDKYCAIFGKLLNWGLAASQPPWNRPGMAAGFCRHTSSFHIMEIIFTPMQDRGRKCSVKLKFNFNAIQCNSSQRWNAKQWR